MHPFSPLSNCRTTEVSDGEDHYTLGERKKKRKQRTYRYTLPYQPNNRDSTSVLRKFRRVRESVISLRGRRSRRDPSCPCFRSVLRDQSCKRIRARK
ncbi:hypothetical protein PUN28_001653 [Cardiocondyla obscurior]|uniref:Uncharacterized protein n=1 Tax=Cardiocondyla obscurior TaxID=286306 RepID=A0AAW2GQJ6_9HYME